MRFRTLLPLLLAVFATLTLLWFIPIPLGVNGEWSWERIPFSGPTSIPSWIVTAICFAVFLLAVLLGLSRMNTSNRLERAIWLTGLTVAGMIWSLQLQDSPPAEYSLAKAPFVLFYKGSSGYFTEAQSGIPDVQKYLADYEAKMAQGDVLHEGTHPPGLPLFYFALIRICDASPGLQDLLIETQPASFQEAIEIIAGLSAGSENPLSRRDSAVLWLATLITLFLSAVTVVPLFLLACEFTSREVSWQVASFWPFVPAALIFQPKSDALYSVISILFLYLWVVAWRRNSKIGYLLAGIVLCGGLCLTLAFLPVGISAVLYVILETWQLRKKTDEDTPASTRFLTAAVCGCTGIVLPMITLRILYEINLLQVWRYNLQNHAGFYLEYPRTYWKWLLVNPIEISLAVGLPLVWMIVQSFRQHPRQQNLQATQTRLAQLWNLMLSCAIVLGLLWISGKNMGEAARLWIIFLPWFLIMIIPYWNMIQSEHNDDHPNPPSFLKRQVTWITALSAQALVCVATTSRITGFHFPPS